MVLCGMIPAGAGEAALEERVNTYWQHRVGMRLDNMYEMENSEFRKGTTVNDYAKRFGPFSEIKGVTVQKIEKSGEDAATAVLNVRYVLTLPLPTVKLNEKSMTVEDRWIREKGTWFHVPRERE